MRLLWGGKEGGWMLCTGACFYEQAQKHSYREVKGAGGWAMRWLRNQGLSLMLSTSLALYIIV